MTNNKKYELTIKTTKEVQGKEIRHIEGGFGENQKCILASDIAIMHEVEAKYINRLINNNISRFGENDLVDLKTGVSEAPVLKMGFTKAQWGNAKNIFLLSERGYQKLVSMMDNKNEMKWRVLDILIDEYFYYKEEARVVTQIAVNNEQTLKELNEHRFSKCRTLNTIEHTELLELPKLLLAFNDYINTLSPKERLIRIKSAIKAIERIETNIALNIKFLPYLALVLNSKEEMLKEKNILQNRMNGGQKAFKTKQIKELKEQLEEAIPSDDKFKLVNVHGFSINRMYTTKFNVFKEPIKVKSFKYKQWIEKFPTEQLQGFEDVDWNKDVYLYVKMKAKFGVDADNCIKSFQDMLSNYYNNGQDNNVQIKEFIIEDRCIDFNDGYIKFYIRN